MKILGKKDIGKGILIEHDGYIDPSTRENSRVLKEISDQSNNDQPITEPLVLYAVLQKYGVENRNGRIYPEDILKREANNYETLIKENRAVGELDHPESSIIAVDRISHNITEVWWEGRTLMGKLEILMSPGYVKNGIVSTKGDMAANLIRKGIRIGVSSRGVGSLERENGKNIVQEDFEIICWDIVTSPSTPGSWMFNEKHEAKPFVENEQKNESKLLKTLDQFIMETKENKKNQII
jgi:hypothetical protein